MKYSIGILLVLSFCMPLHIFAMNRMSPEEARFVPQWKKGDRWIVKTETTTMRPSAAMEPRQDILPSQNLWMYKVINTRDEFMKGEQYRFFHVKASNWRSKKKDLGGFLFVGRLNKPGTKVVALSLIQSAWRNGSNGEEIERDYTKMGPDPFPVINDNSPIPSSFPLFIDNHIIGGKTGIMFEVTKKLGVLPFANDVIQQVDLPRKDSLPPLKMDLSEKEKKGLCTVNVRRFDDNFQVYQIWHRKYPWPLYSTNGDYKAWLVRYKPANK